MYSDELVGKPDDEAALLGLANIAIGEKKWAEATGYIDRARTAAPDDTAPELTLVRAYEQQQDWADAKTVASALSAQFPSDVKCCRRRRRPSSGPAIRTGRSPATNALHELAPNSLPILSRYLNLLNSAKYYREARGVLQDAIDRDPKNPSLKVDLVRVSHELDGVDAAVSHGEHLCRG